MDLLKNLQKWFKVFYISGKIKKLERERKSYESILRKTFAKQFSRVENLDDLSGSCRIRHMDRKIKRYSTVLKKVKETESSCC